MSLGCTDENKNALENWVVDEYMNKHYAYSIDTIIAQAKVCKIGIIYQRQVS